MPVSYKDSLNVFITKYIQTMHIHNINPRSSDMIKFIYLFFNFFSKNRKQIIHNEERLM